MKKLIAVLFLLSTINASGQWVQTNGPNAVGIKSLHSYGTDIYAGTSNGAYRTNNNGNTWTFLGLGNLTVWGFATSGIYLFAGTNDYGAYRSTNNGTTWEQYNTGLSNYSAIAFTSKQHNIYAATLWGGVYHSNSYGTQWTPINSGLQNQGVICLASFETYLAAGTIDGGVYFGGEPWYARNNGLLIDKSINALSFLGTKLFAGTGGNGIYLTTNYGMNWSPVNNGITNLNIFSLAVSGNIIFAGSSTGDVFMSTNYGTDWINKSEGLTPGPSIRALIAPVNYVLLGRDNYVWKRLISEIINVENISSEIPSAYSLFQNYPNPFNPVTKISFDVGNGFPIKTLGNDKVVLKIFDITGKEIATLVNEVLQPGTYEVTFDGSGLNSGVYFYSLRAGNFIDTKRMTLIE